MPDASELPLRLYRRAADVPRDANGCVLTIGNYDGIHRGHQAIFERVRERAAAGGGAATVMTFEPKPAEFFAGAQAPVRLSSLRESIEDIAACGIQRLLALRFDRAFAALTPAQFVQQLLVAHLNVREVFVGEDFRYGHQREGDFDSLSAAGRQHGFAVSRVPTVTIDGERVSSTRVRAALADGRVDDANALLGRAYRISGRVAPGAQLGRTLDVPTANLIMHRRPAPRYGVYAVQVQLADGRRRAGAANLGTRPTVDGRRCLLEVHLLDFNEDIYGQRVQVHFHEFLRSEARFESVEALRTQMLADIERTRRVMAVATR